MSLTILEKDEMFNSWFQWYILPGYDALHIWVVNNSLHGVRFSTWCLAIRKDCSIISGEHIWENQINQHLLESVRWATFDNAFGSGIVDLGLSHIWFQHFVKDIHFSLGRITGQNLDTFPRKEGVNPSYQDIPCLIHVEIKAACENSPQRRYIGHRKIQLGTSQWPSSPSSPLWCSVDEFYNKAELGRDVLPKLFSTPTRLIILICRYWI